MTLHLLRTSALLVGLLVGSGASAAAWAGANVNTQGLGVHVGSSLLNVPLVGPLGIEANVQQNHNNGPIRVAAGLTLRDFSLPLLPIELFGTVGAAYQEEMNLYGEAGLRGSLLGSVGWRAFVRADSAQQVAAGLGVEVRF